MFTLREGPGFDYVAAKAFPRGREAELGAEDYQFAAKRAERGGFVGYQRRVGCV